MSNLGPLPLTLCEIPRHDFNVKKGGGGSKMCPERVFSKERLKGSMLRRVTADYW